MNKIDIDPELVDLNHWLKSLNIAKEWLGTIQSKFIKVTTI